MSNSTKVKMRNKTFTHEFKQECVILVLQHKYPVTQTAEMMNIGLSTSQRWLCQYRGEVRGRYSCKHPRNPRHSPYLPPHNTSLRQSVSHHAHILNKIK